MKLTLKFNIQQKCNGIGLNQDSWTNMKGDGGEFRFALEAFILVAVDSRIKLLISPESKMVVTSQDMDIWVHYLT